MDFCDFVRRVLCWWYFFLLFFSNHYCACRLCADDFFLKNELNNYLSYIRNNITLVEAVYSIAVYKTAKIFSNPGYMGVTWVAGL